MGDHKIYRHPSIALVAVEIRHSGTDPVNEMGWAGIRSRLRKLLPIQDDAQDIGVEVVGAGTPQFTKFKRFLGRDKRLALSIRPGMTTIETVNYQGWDNLREVLRRALEVRAEVSDPAGYERVGLRYINEVRVPTAVDDEAVDWGPWVHASLLGSQPVAEVGLPISDWQGLTRYGPVDGRVLVLRYGPRSGYAVQPDGLLKRPATPQGPFFLLDFDSFWESDGDVPEFNPHQLLSRCDDLHRPLRSLFEGVITPRLREDVLDAE